MPIARRRRRRSSAKSWSEIIFESDDCSADVAARPVEGSREFSGAEEAISSGGLILNDEGEEINVSGNSELN